MENNAEKSLLAKLRMVDFSIYETILFLDAHPQDAEALAYYHKLLCQRQKLVDEHESKVGPLTIFGNTCTAEWKWVNGPWPWEYGAN